MDDWTIRVPVRKSEKEKTERKKSGTNKDTSVSPDPIKKLDQRITKQTITARKKSSENRPKRKKKI